MINDIKKSKKRWGQAKLYRFPKKSTNPDIKSILNRITIVFFNFFKLKYLSTSNQIVLKSLYSFISFFINFNQIDIFQIHKLLSPIFSIFRFQSISIFTWISPDIFNKFILSLWKILYFLPIFLHKQINLWDKIL